MESTTNDKHQSKSKINIQTMMDNLDEMYDKEETLIKKIKDLMIEYEQLKDDMELTQTIIMHQSNKESRKFDLKKFFKGKKF